MIQSDCMNPKRIVPQKLKNYYHLLTSILANKIYQNPAKSLKIIGITGTDGKTTTANLIYQILRKDKYRASLISTVNASIAGKTYDTGFHVTTPSAWSTQKFLKRMKESTTDYGVLEITSHALDQNRVWGVDFDIGVLTNVSHEHLDYHGTYQEYIKAKSKLFKHSRVSVLNRDDRSFVHVSPYVKGRVVTYGLGKEADVFAKNIQMSAKGLKFECVTTDGSFELKSKLIGEFNVYNILASVSVAKILNISNERIKEALEDFEGVAGRMERLETDRDFDVIIDFAHTPNAMESILKTIRKISKGKVIVCFGAAAERDIEKRPMMGRIAGKLADLVILTNEDPRFEDPNKILTDIAKGVVRSGGVLNKTFWMVEDRAKAIKLALSKARNSDTVLILGKGHEKSMSIKGTEYPWSDKDIAMKALRS